MFSVDAPIGELVHCVRPTGTGAGGQGRRSEGSGCSTARGSPAGFCGWHRRAFGDGQRDVGPFMARWDSGQRPRGSRPERGPAREHSSGRAGDGGGGGVQFPEGRGQRPSCSAITARASPSTRRDGVESGTGARNAAARSAEEAHSDGPGARAHSGPGSPRPSKRAAPPPHEESLAGGVLGKRQRRSARAG